jgi:hypothetical protein
MVPTARRTPSRGHSGREPRRRTPEDPWLPPAQGGGELSSEVQIGTAGWLPDYPAESGFIRPTLACDSSSNPGRFCDPEIDARMRKAARLATIDAHQSQRTLVTDRARPCGPCSRGPVDQRTVRELGLAAAWEPSVQSRLGPADRPDVGPLGGCSPRSGEPAARRALAEVDRAIVDQAPYLWLANDRRRVRLRANGQRPVQPGVGQRPARSPVGSVAGRFGRPHSPCSPQERLAVLHIAERVASSHFSGSARCDRPPA